MIGQHVHRLSLALSVLGTFLLLFLLSPFLIFYPHPLSFIFPCIELVNLRKSLASILLLQCSLYLMPGILRKELASLTPHLRSICRKAGQMSRWLLASATLHEAVA